MRWKDSWKDRDGADPYNKCGLGLQQAAIFEVDYFLD